ncbi:hypothetical protein E2C01_036413 [Portunus trituberculatus]|uniref:Uncharacterized protein n=1 Tax=Portunus trituberculatus TaxID=210409 RepID=A0A5B7F8N5_PORTR|nr:hypothetical protein [Portunus trituberculatus]
MHPEKKEEYTTTALSQPLHPRTPPSSPSHPPHWEHSLALPCPAPRLHINPASRLHPSRSRFRGGRANGIPRPWREAGLRDGRDGHVS